MRKMFYECLTKNVVVKTVTTYADAVAWKDKDDDNDFRVAMKEIPYLALTEEVETKEKRKEKRLAKIAAMLGEG